VSHEKFEDAWQARQCTMPISPVLKFAPEGLVLGAGTVVVAAESMRQLKSLQSQEARVLALLAAAYGRVIAQTVLGNIKRAAKAWEEGEDCLAYIHLAHARLPALQKPRDAARRLFLADSFMKAGLQPRAIFEALHADPSYVLAIEKFYNPNQPRVPAGSGRTSGQWTREPNGGEQPISNSPGRPTAGGSALSYVDAAPAASRSSGVLTRLLSWMADLDAAQIAELAAYALRVLTPVSGAAAVFGILFAPSPNEIRVEGDVADIPGLRYSWNRDELTLHLTYDHAGDQRTFAAYLDGDEFRDENGRVIGRVIGGNKIAIDLFAVLPDLVKKSNEPRLCPAPAKDMPGSDRGLQYKDNLARQYEDFLKPLINPDAPTPSGYAYYLPNPSQGNRLVSYDDCQKKTIILFDYKGYYGALLMFNSNARKSFLSQSMRQIEASGGRPVVWIFADEQDALRTHKLFEKVDKGREYITIVHVPWTTRGAP
jgi:hypothetical protein